ncbi:MFS transporter [Sorangium cellulosum]|uniref:Multidrug efflux pump Tap n=1 Tax=Sorangium cellulosum TaxID=56 RepID=A0A2L0EJG8_SORCE|nr:MFS transporter [Sorangium cellulosum]AUX39438.1 MFS transporter [Sorangium cellulosum]
MTASPPAETPKSPFDAFKSRDFRVYAPARLLATVAFQMQSVAVGFQIYSLTRSPLALGYVGLAQFVPVAGLSLVAGHAADRFDRRGILVLCYLTLSLASLALFFIARSPSPSLPAIYGTLVLIGTARAFQGPAGSSLLPALVPTAHFQNAATWQSTLWQVGAIGGPSLGGLLYGAWGAPAPVYLTAGVALAAASAGILAVRVRTGRMEKRPPSLATALAGLRYVARKKLLLGAISLDFMAVFLGGAVALLPAYAADVLHVGSRGLGFLRAAPAVGAGLMAVLLAFRPITRHAGPKMLFSVGVFGLATIAFGLSQSFYLSLAALTVLGAADMVSVVVRMTLEQLATPPEVRGRVSAVNMVFVGASNELGEFESGTLASLVGTVPAVVFGGVGTISVVLLWSRLFPELRAVDRLEDVRPTAEEGAERAA